MKWVVPRLNDEFSIWSLLVVKVNVQQKIFFFIFLSLKHSISTAALAPSPTRTITSTEPSPAHPKRKLETTVSTENAVEKKREKPLDQLRLDPSKMSINEEIEIAPDTIQSEPEVVEIPSNSLATVSAAETISEPIVANVLPVPAELKDLNKIEEMCDELCNESPKEPSPEKKKIIKKKVITKSGAGAASDKPSVEPSTKKTSPTKITKKVVNKTKTTDLVPETEPPSVPVERKNSLPEDDKPSTERRRSKIFETAEKFQNANQANNDKLKKIVIPGVSVGSFKKEFERKASLTSTNLPTPTGERKLSLEKQGSDSSGGQPTPTESRKSSIGDSESVITPTEEKVSSIQQHVQADEPSVSNDSKSSLTSFSLEEARRSMENSIALLNQAKTESNNELDQLCDKTKNVAVSEDRQEKLKSAREIIGNAIPVGRMCMGVRKPPVPFGMNGRSISGSVVPSPTASASKPERRSVRLQMGADPNDIRTATVSVSSPEQRTYDQEPFANMSSKREYCLLPRDSRDIQRVFCLAVAVGTVTETPESNTTKTSRAEIVLKSATLPRRKAAKTDVQSDTSPKVDD